MSKANPVTVQKHLKGVHYPVEKSELIKHARKHGAHQEVISLLEQLPEHKQFGNPAELNKAMGKIH